MDKEIFEKMYKNHILYLTGKSEYDDITNGNFSGLNFSGMVLDGLNISNADFTNADFTNTSMRCCTFHDCIFNGARFRDTDASCSEFDRSTFRYANIKSSNMIACSFNRCQFTRTFSENTDFTRSVFTNSFFEGNRFECVNLFGSILADTFFDGCQTTFNYCNFDECNTTGLKGLKSICISQCIFRDGKRTNSLRFLNQKEFVKYVPGQIVFTIKSLFHTGKLLKPSNTKALLPKNK